MNCLTGRANEIAHIFDDSQYSRFHLFDKLTGALGIILGDSLRRRDQDRAVDRAQRLHNSQMFVTRTRGRIYHQKIQVSPFDIINKLLNRFVF